MRCIRPLLIASLALAAAVAPAAAQDTVTIDMTRDEVVARRGEPLLERVVGELTVLLFDNSCVPRCAANDVVLLRGGRVVAAIAAEPAAAPVTAADSLTVLLDADVFTEAMLSARAELFPDYVADPFSTLHAPEPLRVRPYRLSGTFGRGEIEQFERARVAPPRE